MLSESLSGISTIRANNALEYFQEKFRLVHDAHGEEITIYVISGNANEELSRLSFTSFSWNIYLIFRLPTYNFRPSILRFYFLQSMVRIQNGCTDVYIPHSGEFFCSGC